MEAKRQEKFATFISFLEVIQNQVKFGKPINSNLVDGQVVCIMDEEGYIFSDQVGFVHILKIGIKDECWPLKVGEIIRVPVRKNRISEGLTGTFFGVNLLDLVKYVAPEWSRSYYMDSVEDHFRRMFDSFNDLDNFMNDAYEKFPWILKPSNSKIKTLMDHIQCSSKAPKPREHSIGCYDLWKGLNLMFRNPSQGMLNRKNVSVRDEFAGHIVSLMEEDGLIFNEDVGLVYFHIKRAYWKGQRIHNVFPKKIWSNRVSFRLTPFNLCKNAVLKDDCGMLNVHLGNVIKFKAIKVWVDDHPRPSSPVIRNYTNWRKKKDPDTFMKDCYENWIDSNAMVTGLKTVYLRQAGPSTGPSKTTHQVILQEIKMPSSNGLMDKFEELKPIIKYCPSNEGILDIGA